MTSSFLKVLSITFMLYHILCEDGNETWTNRFKCGGGLNCLGLDPPADGCYYNRVKKLGWCFHIVEGKGSIYFTGKKETDEKVKMTRLLQTSPTPCRMNVCNQCESACYRSDCATPEECDNCNCFSVNSNSTALSNDWCCPLPSNLSNLDEDLTNIDFNLLMASK